MTIAEQNSIQVLSAAGAVSVRDHGAVGDGQTNDSAAVQAAINAAVATGGPRVVHFPPGNYLLNSQVHANLPNEALCNGIVLYGDGPYVSKITQAKANTAGAIKVTVNGNQETVSIRNLSIHSLLSKKDDPGMDNGIALHILSSLDQASDNFGSRESFSTILENIFIEGDAINSGMQGGRGVWKTCLRMENIWYPTIRGINLVNWNSVAGSKGIWLTDCYDPRIIDSYVRGGAERGILIDTDRASGKPSFEGGMLINTNIVGALDGLVVNHSTAAPPLYEVGFHVIGGHYNCQRHSLRFNYHRQINIVGGYFYLRREEAADGDLTPSAIYMERASDGQITGCQFLEPGYYSNDSNASVGVKIGTDSSGINIDSCVFNTGGIGVRSTATGINRLGSSNIYSLGQRTGVWAPFKPVVDTTGALMNGSPSTGWAAPTGTATKTAFNTATVTTAQLAERVKTLLDYLLERGDLKA